MISALGIGFVVFAASFLVIIAISSLLSVKLQIAKICGPGQELPPISIIKPLCGANDVLEANLRSFVELSYPASIEVIFIAESADDRAWEVVSALAPEQSGVTIKAAASTCKAGWLPKTWNLAQGVMLASYDNLVFADADVRIESHVLVDLVERSLASDVGAAYAHPVCKEPRGSGGLFDAIVTNYTAYLVQPVLERLHLDHLAGTLWATRRDVLEQIGGFDGVQNCIADDICLGRKIRAAGYCLALGAFPVFTYSGLMSLSDFVTHQMRWLRTWRLTAGYSALLAFFFSATTLGALGVIFDQTLWPIVPLLAFGEMAVLAQQIGLQQRPPQALELLLCPFALCGQQLLALLSLAGNTVQWAGRWYTLSRGGVIIRTST